MQRPRVLLIDDEPAILELISITLQRMQIDAETADCVADGIRLLKQNQYQFCLTDMRMPDGTGLQIVEYIQDNCSELPVAVATAYGDVDTATKALKLGAFDFVAKPLDLDMLRSLVTTALKLSKADIVGKAVAETIPVEASTPVRKGDELLFGQSPAYAKLKEIVAKVARSQAPVHIFGESGTGKERVANAIHLQGPRASSPFVPVNCGAIPAELVETEFFGHVKGSFTGAASDKQGLFSSANGGTLFLDEVADLPLHMQVKLLRAIQEKAIRPVGGTSEIAVDVRILSATHKDIAALVKDGSFREDLYYRINVIQLNVPTLQQRKEDLPGLIRLICHDIAGRLGTEPIKLDQSALDLLANYHFPGNIRELENILERAATISTGVITASDLTLHSQETTEPSLQSLKSSPASAGSPAESATELPEGYCLESYLEDVERQLLESALRQADYNKTNAAKALGISFRAFRYRLKKLGID
jgi:two-component system response regulator PilR (NtrC family)